MQSLVSRATILVVDNSQAALLDILLAAKSLEHDERNF